MGQVRLAEKQTPGQGRLLIGNQFEVVVGGGGGGGSRAHFIFILWRDLYPRYLACMLSAPFFMSATSLRAWLACQNNSHTQNKTRSTNIGANYRRIQGIRVVMGNSVKNLWKMEFDPKFIHNSCPRCCNFILYA